MLGEAVSEIYEKYIDGNAEINFNAGLKFAGKLEDRILESQINSQEKNKNMVFLDNITEKDVSK